MFKRGISWIDKVFEGEVGEGCNKMLDMIQRFKERLVQKKR